MKYAFRLTDIRKSFGQTVALDGVDLALPGGTILGLIGENGAGKSTLIKCLLGLLRPEEGTVELLKGEGLNGVGYVPDAYPFSPQLTVGQVEKVMAGVFPHWDGALFEKYVERFSLDRKKKGKDLSRGMKMKLVIAVALSHHPKLLVLDEATAGLDPVVREEILEEFAAFAADEDHAVLLSSHITSDLEKLCDYVCYLHEGKVMLAGERDELQDRYARWSCTREELAQVDPALLAGQRVGQFGCQVLLRDRAGFSERYPQYAQRLDRPSLEDLMIFTAREAKA